MVARTSPMDELANYVRGLDEQLSIIDRRKRGRYELHLAHAAEACSRIEVAAWNVYKSQRTDIDSELSSNIALRANLIGCKSATGYWSHDCSWADRR